MDKVNIILTTYNGEKYLAQLLDSLLMQTYKNITVYIRDDGSTDKTRSILKEYYQKGNNGIDFCIIEDDLGNLGYVNNFLHVIRTSAEADYYAFCDQDDHWLPDKIERAVTAMSTRPSDKCLLYTSNYETRDENLNFISEGHVPTPIKQLDVGKSLSLYDGGWLLGFTLVINKKLKQIAFDNDAKDMYSHDIWVQSVAAGFGGEMIYDEKVSAYFRRHEKSTSVAESNINTSFFHAWMYRFQEFFDGKMFSKLSSGIDTYVRLFSDKVEAKADKEFLSRFADCKDGKNHVVRKVLYPHRLKKSILLELAWRFSILSGKL